MSSVLNHELMALYHISCMHVDHLFMFTITFEYVGYRQEHCNSFIIIIIGIILVTNVGQNILPRPTEIAQSSIGESCMSTSGDDFALSDHGNTNTAMYNRCDAQNLQSMTFEGKLTYALKFIIIIKIILDLCA